MSCFIKKTQYWSDTSCTIRHILNSALDYSAGDGPQILSFGFPRNKIGKEKSLEYLLNREILGGNEMVCGCVFNFLQEKNVHLKLVYGYILKAGRSSQLYLTCLLGFGLPTPTWTFFLFRLSATLG